MGRLKKRRAREYWYHWADALKEAEATAGEVLFRQEDLAKLAELLDDLAYGWSPLRTEAMIESAKRLEGGQ